MSALGRDCKDKKSLVMRGVTGVTWHL